MVSLLSLAFLSLSTESGSKVWNLLNTLQKQQPLHAFRSLIMQ